MPKCIWCEGTSRNTSCARRDDAARVVQVLGAHRGRRIVDLHRERERRQDARRRELAGEIANPLPRALRHDRRDGVEQFPIALRARRAEVVRERQRHGVRRADRDAGERVAWSLGLNPEGRARSEVVVGPHAGEHPVDHRAHLGHDGLQRLAVADGVTDRGAANRERHHVARCRRAGEDHRGVRIGRAGPLPLVVPEDAHVHVGVALEPELLELPEVPGRGLLVAVVGVEVDGERDVRILLRRVRNVLRDERPAGNRSRSSTRCWRRSCRTRAVITTVWLPAATLPRDLQVRRRAAVLVEVEIVVVVATPSTETPTLPQSVFRNVPR